MLWEMTTLFDWTESDRLFWNAKRTFIIRRRNKPKMSKEIKLEFKVRVLYHLDFIQTLSPRMIKYQMSVNCPWDYYTLFIKHILIPIVIYCTLYNLLNYLKLGFFGRSELLSICNSMHWEQDMHLIKQLELFHSVFSQLYRISNRQPNSK